MFNRISQYKKEIPTFNKHLKINYKLIFSFCLLAFVLTGCAGYDDVRFARHVNELLLKGRYSARTLIDWPSLVMFEYNVGKEYLSLPNDNEKMDYQRALIDNLKRGFQKEKGSVKAFTNWRLFNGNNPTMKLVAADCGPDKKIVLFFVVKYDKGKRKLVEVKAVQLEDRAQFDAYEKEQKNGLPPLLTK